MLPNKAARLVLLTLGVTLAVLSAPRAADAQPADKVARIGELWVGNPEGVARWRSAFLEGMKELGYQEARTVVYEPRFGHGDKRRLEMLARDLANLDVDVILVAASDSLEAVKRVTTTIPIVNAGFGDPASEGVASLARPGGNITGLSWFTPELAGKRLQILKEVIPNLSRVAVLADSVDRVAAMDLFALARVAPSLNLTLHVVRVESPADFSRAFSAIQRGRVQALVVVDTALTVSERTRITRFALANHLPTISETRLHAEAGGLLTYGATGLDIFKRAATYVDKILKGAKPGDLPVEQPTKFELILNLKTAEALGLTIPPSVLVRADEIIR